MKFFIPLFVIVYRYFLRKTGFPIVDKEFFWEAPVGKFVKFKVKNVRGDEEYHTYKCLASNKWQVVAINDKKLVDMSLIEYIHSHRVPRKNAELLNAVK